MLRDIEGSVKWFDPKKGFGFVDYGDTRDALLHMNVLVQTGNDTVLPGTPIKCQGLRTDKGTRITEVFWLGDPPAKKWVTCTWKWFHKTPGYGFALTPDGRDVYIHRKMLRRCGVEMPENQEIAGLLIDVTIHSGGTGLHATEAKWTVL